MMFVAATLGVGCGKKDDGASAGSGATTGATGATDCLAGTWVYKLGDRTAYTFNADKTGSKVYKEDPPSAFIWHTAGNKVTMQFPSNALEADVDCAARTLSFGGIKLEKE